MQRSAFLFGKLPAHGDFFTRGLAPSERDAIDAWLTASLAEAEAAWGAAFASAYDDAAQWRFAFRDAGGWRAGSLAPSVDAVGRRFPIMLGFGELADDEVEAAASVSEALLYRAIEGAWTADRSIEAASNHELAGNSVWTGGDRWWTVLDMAAIGSVAGARPPALLRTMLISGERNREGAA